LAAGMTGRDAGLVPPRREADAAALDIQKRGRQLLEESERPRELVDPSEVTRIDLVEDIGRRALGKVRY
jgi:hypothetical protein